MSTTVPPIRLGFVGEFTEREALEARDRGYLSHVFVEINGGILYPVFFYDPTRLQQDLELNAQHGRTFVADPGMIVLPKITIDAMEQAARRLYAEGFFVHLVSFTQDQLAKADPYSWPPK